MADVQGKTCVDLCCMVFGGSFVCSAGLVCPKDALSSVACVDEVRPLPLDRHDDGALGSHLVLGFLTDGFRASSLRNPANRYEVRRWTCKLLGEARSKVR